VAVAEYSIPGLHVREHRVPVPLRWDRPDDSPALTLFARELVDPARSHDELPLLLFLQGGPGGQGPRPVGRGWWTEALRTHRVILVDQRGTGRSSRVDGHVIDRLGSAERAADYLACFRQDSIVADAEHLRRTVYDGATWATLGQSYGGFLTLAYLSAAPEALTACYVTGGLPGITADADAVYRRTYPHMQRRSAEFYRRFPQDAPVVAEIADLLAGGGVTFPNGDPFTRERLQTLGMPFGMSTGFDATHWLLDTAWSTGGTPTLSDGFTSAVQHTTGFDDNPLYAVLQECIYQQGTGATGWAAQRARDGLPGLAPDLRPLQFTGEMMYPWMFEQYRSLRPFRAAADVLAARTEWPVLYDADRLARNDVPIAAVQYVDDPYVDLDLALETVEAVGNAHVWVTNEFLHDGLRVAGETIWPRLLDLASGRV
jgi:pimeloyl-ACP methyl ester carboxylesterase